jgi:hypothetical protein
MSSAPTPLAKVEINKAKNDPPRQIEATFAHLWSLAQFHAISRNKTVEYLQEGYPLHELHIPS